MEEITAGALIILVLGTLIKEIVSWFKQRSLLNQESRLAAVEIAIKEAKTILETLSRESKEMYDWHNKSDEDNVKIWYVRKSLENVLRDTSQAIAILARNSELQTNLLKDMIESQKIVMKEQIILANELKGHSRNRDE